MGGSNDQKVFKGFKYWLDMHLVFCHSPLDEIRTIYVQDKVVYGDQEGETPITGNTSLSIQRHNIFGGMDREGGIGDEVIKIFDKVVYPAGIRTNLDVEFGGPSQGANVWLVNRLNQYVPAFRGVVALILKDMYIGNSPYLKPWWIIGKRTLKGWDGNTIWYSAKAAIGDDMNPAHIIYESLVSQDWGMGVPTSLIDEQSFIDAADTLYNEGFGMSIQLRTSGQSVEEFITDIGRHINAFCKQDEVTGLYSLKLLRDDYDPVTLDTIDESYLSEIKNFQRVLYGDTVNEITFNYTDPDSFEQATITIQDIAQVSIQGEIKNAVLNYHGIRNHDIAQKVAQRELKIQTSPLFACELIGDRRLLGYSIGDVFNLSWERYGIVSIPVRVIGFDKGNFDKNVVKINVMEDVFGTGSAIYAPPDTQWTDPVNEPADMTKLWIEEIPYFLTQLFESTLPSDDEAVAVYGKPATEDTLDFRVMHDGTAAKTDDTRFLAGGMGEFCPVLTLDTAVGPDDTTFAVSTTFFYDIAPLPYAARIDNEIVGIVDYDRDAGEMTVVRGTLDTVPWSHSAGADVICWAQDFYYMRDLYPEGDELVIKALTQTLKGTLDIADATYVSKVIEQRRHRPYPVGNLRVSYIDTSDAAHPKAVIIWDYRNRLTMLTEPIGYRAGNVATEVDVKYDVVEEGAGTTTTEVTTHPFNSQLEESGGNFVKDVTVKSHKTDGEKRYAWQAMKLEISVDMQQTVNVDSAATSAQKYGLQRVSAGWTSGAFAGYNCRNITKGVDCAILDNTSSILLLDASLGTESADSFEVRHEVVDDSGTATATGTTTLTDTLKSWTTDEHAGKRCYNLTQGTNAAIVSNTGTVLTLDGDLSTGIGDSYEIRDWSVDYSSTASPERFALVDSGQTFTDDEHVNRALYNQTSGNAGEVIGNSTTALFTAEDLSTASSDNYEVRTNGTPLVTATEVPQRLDVDGNVI